MKDNQFRSHCFPLVSETKHWLSTLTVPGVPSNTPHHLSTPSKGINCLSNNFILQRKSTAQYLKNKWYQNSKFGARQMDTNQLLQFWGFFLYLELYFLPKLQNSGQQTFIVKSQVVNILCFVGQMVLLQLHDSVVVGKCLQIMCKQIGVAIFQKILRALKFEFHIMFIYHGILFLFSYFPTILKCKKTFIACGWYKNWQWAG